MRGFIDGAMSTLGIVVGASSASETVILAAATGGAVANGISNLLSAISAASTERYTALRDIEKAMVAKDLKGSDADKRINRQVWMDGIADGLSTIAGGAIPIIPYLLAPPDIAIWISIGGVVIAIFVLGMYLGKISRRNIFFSGMKMAVFAVIVAIIVYLIQSVIAPSE